MEVLESRALLAGNGVVGVPAQFSPPLHRWFIDSIPQDPNNTGMVPSTSVTFVGHVFNPAGGDVTAVHSMLKIDALENGTSIGEVTWDTSTPGSPQFHQDPNAANQADFSIPATLLSSGPAVQDVTFRLTLVDIAATRDVVRTDNMQPLTATLTVAQIVTNGPVITSISPVTTPRTEPVQSVDVTFSKPIMASTFTTAAVTLTRDGAPVTLGSDVTISQVTDTTFRINGLTAATTPAGTYVLTVSASNVQDTLGNTGAGSQAVNFVVQTVVPVTGGPKVTQLQRFGFHAQPTLLVLTFDRDLDPTRAQNPSNYQVLNPGRDNTLGTADDVVVPIASVAYNATNRTVTLALAQRLSVFIKHRVIARGTGATPITDVNGNVLDGDGDGTAGGDYVANFGREILAGSVSSGNTIQRFSNVVSLLLVRGVGSIQSSQLSNPTPASSGSSNVSIATTPGKWVGLGRGRFRHFQFVSPTSTS